MGTSSTYSGPGKSSSLIPSWLDKPLDPSLNNDQPVNGETPDERPNQIPADPERFRAPRTAFTSFAKSGGSRTSAAANAVGGYVSRSVGGARSATQRMGAARSTVAGLVSFINNVRTQGLEATLDSFNLGKLKGLAPTQILNRLVDSLCPNDGSVDTGIARSAYLECTQEIVDAGITDIAAVNDDQLFVIVEGYVAESVFLRILNDVGNKAVQIGSIGDVRTVELKLKSLIRSWVGIGMQSLKIDLAKATKQDAMGVADRAYFAAFSFLQNLGPEASNG